VSIGPSSGIVAAGGAGRRRSFARRRQPSRWRAPRRLAALALALMAAALLVTPAVGAEPPGAVSATGAVDRASALTVPRDVARDDDQDAYEGGLVPPVRSVVIPSVELGLTQQRPIPLGVTCSCAVDRVGQTSQFDITVIEVVQDANAMVLQLNRFNRPPRAGARYVAAYVGQQYIAGPVDQAYTTSEADWKATATDQRLSDTALLLHTDVEYRPRADVFPKNYVNGWLIYELPLNRPAFLVWNYSFVGERGIWFALQ
jgi:hypothetical protein